MGATGPGERLLGLVYDTRTTALPPGVRALLRAERHILLAVDEYEVLLELGTDPRGGWPTLAGQVLAGGEPVEQALVTLVGEPSAVQTDEDGWFKVTRLTRPVCDVRVTVPGQLLRLPPISVAAPLI